MAKQHQLTAREYHALFKGWGYDVRLNLCNDDIVINGEKFTDQLAAIIRQQARDYGTSNSRGTSVGATEDSLCALAEIKKFHPVKDYFDSLKWDGADHLATLFAHFKNDGFFNRWLASWLAGAISRVYDGWQNPMLVLVGDQGIGKSYLANWLCSPLPKMFVESPVCPDYKDHRLRLIETFIWEVQELGATTRRADQDALKAFITLGWINERKAYGKRPVQKRAICSFIGTVNPDAGFLTDLTGNRRYLVTTLLNIDWAYSNTINLDQVWAQAVAMYRADESWKLTADEQKLSNQQSEKYMVVNPTQVFLEKLYIATHDANDFVPTSDILSALDTHASIKPNTGTARQVASVLRSWEAVAGRPRINGVLQPRGYSGIKSR